MKILTTLLLALSLNSFAHVVTGDYKSLNATMANLHREDGAQAEHHDIALGQLIKTHPANFLLALKANEKTIKRLDALVGNFGENFVDRFDDQKIEANLRIKALEKAKGESKDQDIKRLADKCIEALKKKILTIEGLKKS